MKSKKKMSSKNNSKVNESDIISLILADHVPLKKLIKVLKDTEVKMAEKKPSFEKFSSLLLAHAKSEAESLYVHMKQETGDLKTEAFEGETEHNIAESLVEQINQISDKNEWLAKVKVLAELVEHHIEEEEGEMFKTIRKEMDIETRMEIGAEYVQLKADYEDNMPSGSKSPKQKRSNQETERYI